MKILEIGSCCASIPQIYANTLNTKHVSFFSHKYLQNAENEISFLTKYSGYWGLSLLNRLIKIRQFIDLIKEYEFLHFHYNSYLPFYIDIKLYKKKKIGIHYHGDDIRQSPWKSKFASKFDYIFLSTPDLCRFFPKKGIFIPSPVKELPYIGISDLSNQIVIGHMSGDLSNKKTRKGTDIIINNMKKLKKVDEKFLFKLISGVSHQIAIDELKNVDIFIDQITPYGSYGISAVEAMYLGKPVISSIHPEYYENCPIVPINAEGNNLINTLIDLKNDFSKMKEISNKVRTYAIQHHSPKNAVNKFLKIINN